MIAVDTSALMAILGDEDEADACIACLVAADAACMSGGTLAEALIVAENRGVGAEMENLVSGLGIEVIPVTEWMAKRCAEAYAQWGRGRHAAGLNFGDCFGYVVAKEQRCPLLFVGDDFTRTDVQSALSQPSTNSH